MKKTRNSILLLDLENTKNESEVCSFVTPFLTNTTRTQHSKGLFRKTSSFFAKKCFMKTVTFWYNESLRKGDFYDIKRIYKKNGVDLH